MIKKKKNTMPLLFIKNYYYDYMNSIVIKCFKSYIL